MCDVSLVVYHCICHYHCIIVDVCFYVLYTFVIDIRMTTTLT